MEQSLLQKAIEFHQAGNLVDAEKIYRSILTEEPDHPDANHNLGVIAVQTGQAALGLPHFKKALAKWLGLGQTANAQKAADYLIKTFPESALGFLALGVVYQRQGQNDKAIEALKEAVVREPENPDAQYNLGVMYGGFKLWSKAVECYERALNLNPSFAAEVHCNMGYACKEIGNIVSAEKHYRKALELKPDYVLACCNLGVVLSENGKENEAEELYSKVLQLEPHHAGVWVNLGNLLRAKGEVNRAVECYKSAIKIDPDIVEAYINLGGVLKSSGSINEAEKCCRKLLELEPKSPKYHCNLGDIFRDQGRRQESEKCYEKAMYLDSLNTALPLVHLGYLYQDYGKFNEAESYFYQAIEREPEFIPPFSALAHLRKMKKEDMEWLNKAHTLVSKSASPEESILLFNAMGKFCDDIGDYEEAFSHYQRANEIKKQMSPFYDKAAHEALVDLICQSHPIEVINKVHSGSNLSELPVFILGMPRSGTSLLEQIIASHPAAYGAGELRFWWDITYKYPEDFKHARYTQSMLEEAAKDCLDNLYSRSRIAGDDKQPEILRVVDKMPTNFWLAGFIHAVFPKARIIHTMRHPIDTCLSIYFQNFGIGHNYASDLDNLAHNYRQYSRLMKHWKSVFPQDVFMEVQYEDLVEDVEDTENHSRKIIEFIGLDWDERCLSFHKTKRAVGTSSNWQVRQPVYKTSKERWRNYERFIEPLLGLGVV